MKREARYTSPAPSHPLGRTMPPGLGRYHVGALGLDFSVLCEARADHWSPWQPAVKLAVADSPQRHLGFPHLTRVRFRDGMATWVLAEHVR